MTEIRAWSRNPPFAASCGSAPRAVREFAGATGGEDEKDGPEPGRPMRSPEWRKAAACRVTPVLLECQWNARLAPPAAIHYHPTDEQSGFDLLDDDPGGGRGEPV
jgi:hypothetical protein